MQAHQEIGNLCLKLKGWVFLDISDFSDQECEEWDDAGEGQVKQILIWHGTYISGFQTIYERNNAIHISKRHGGEEGNLEMVYLERPLKWMSGHYVYEHQMTCYEDEEKLDSIHSVITSLKFGDGRKTYGPFGFESGFPFEFKGKDEIIGFHGFSNIEEHYGYICAIGPYIKTKAVAFLEANKVHTHNDKLYMKLSCFGFKNINRHLKWDDGYGGYLKQILIWHDETISGFQTIYDRNNTILISQRHGGYNGDFKNIYLKGPLTWMSGTYKTVQNATNAITSLKFGNEEKTYGPFGFEVGKPFLFKGKNEIVGFHGWCSKNTKWGYISAIGPYIRIKENRQIKEQKAV